MEKQQEPQSPVIIWRKADSVIVEYGGQETCLRKKSVIEVVYDYVLEEVRFITQAGVLRHPMKASALDELDTLIEEFISDILVS